MRTVGVEIGVKLKDEATESGKAISEKLETFFGGAAKNIAKTFDQSFQVAGKGIELIINDASRLEKAFGESFHSINDEFAKLSDSIFAETQKLIKGIDKFPRVFSAGFAGELKTIKEGSIDNFKSINAFGLNTAKSLNQAFSDNFFNAFKGHTASMSGMWAAFAETMKNNFLKALADMASAYVTSAVFQAFSGGLNILGFSGGGSLREGGRPAVGCCYAR